MGKILFSRADWIKSGYHSGKCPSQKIKRKPMTGEEIQKVMAKETKVSHLPKDWRGRLLQ
jgi:hypothetical protein